MEAFLGEGRRRHFQDCRRVLRGPRNARWRFLRAPHSPSSLLRLAQVTEGGTVTIVLGKVVYQPPIQAHGQDILTRQGSSTSLPVEYLRHEDSPWKTRFKRVPA